MRAAERPGIVPLRQRRYRAPADRPQARGRPAVMAERKVKRVAARSVGGRSGKAAEIEREARRALLASANAVGAPAANRAANARGVEHEAEPALIFEAVPLGRIERAAYAGGHARRGLAQPLDP